MFNGLVGICTIQVSANILCSLINALTNAKLQHSPSPLPPSETPQAYELYKIGLFKFPWGWLEMDREGGVNIYKSMHFD